MGAALTEAFGATGIQYIERPSLPSFSEQLAAKQLNASFTISCIQS